MGKAVDPMIRFWSKVDKSGDCWEWKAGRNAGGYGLFYMNKKMTLAHRTSLLLSGTDVQQGQVACHKCDNPACVRPDHLYMGTKMDNALDMSERKRGFGQDEWKIRNGSHRLINRFGKVPSDFSKIILQDDKIQTLILEKLEGRK